LDRLIFDKETSDVTSWFSFLWILRLSAKGGNLYLSSLLCEVYTCIFFALIAKCNFSCNANRAFYMQWIYLYFLVLFFDCANLYFAKCHPPFARARGWTSSTSQSSVCKFCETPPPFARHAGGDEFLRAKFRLRLFAHQGLSCLGLFAHKSFSALGFLLIRTFMSSNFYLGLFARNDFSALGFLLIRTFMSSNFCLGLFARKDFAIKLVGSKAKGSEILIRDCAPCLLFSSVIACFMRRWLHSSLGEEG
jgi:hypothetical protein